MTIRTRSSHFRAVACARPAAIVLLLAGVALALPSALATAQDAAEANGAQDEAEQQVDGYASPEHAAQGFFDGLRNGDEQAVRRAVPPEERETFDRHGRRLMEAVSVKALSIGDSRRDEDVESRAYVYYEWEVEVDEEEVIAAALDDLRDDLREAGLNEEQLERHLEELAPSVEEFALSHVEQMRKEHQRMILIEVEERWYVEDIVDPSFSEDERVEEED